MKIISWNCKKYYSSKAKLILLENPDIVVVPECENPKLNKYENDAIKPTDFIWFSDPETDRGIGVFSYSKYKLKLLDTHNINFKYILPIAVSCDDLCFILLAVWTHQPYIEQLWNAIKYYDDLLDNNVIIAGDFNSNSFWDKNHKVNSHSNLVKHLENKNICSLYHLFKNEKQGEESLSTFYWYHHENKPFHLDYCFASPNFINKFQHFKIGKFEDWSKFSDHMPLTVTFGL